MSLTPKQRRLRAEIEEISSIIGMNFSDIENYPPEARTPRLEIARNQLVRGEIIMGYTLMDEYLSIIIANYYFAETPLRGRKNFPWRSKKFRLFCHHVLDGLYLLPKLALVREIKEVPKEIRDTLKQINALRNAIAHSLFPENRRQYKVEKKVLYQRLNIFTPEGIEAFKDDVRAAQAYFMARAFGTSGTQKRSS